MISIFRVFDQTSFVQMACFFQNKCLYRQDLYDSKQYHFYPHAALQSIQNNNGRKTCSHMGKNKYNSSYINLNVYFKMHDHRAELGSLSSPMKSSCCADTWFPQDSSNRLLEQ